MPAEPLFTLSVVVPTHGGRESVADTVRALLAQPSDGLEVIVVSDGDPAPTREVLDGIDDQRLRLVSQGQQGPAAARNLGLREARNDWVAFVDDDDVPRSNWFGAWAAHAREPVDVVTACVKHWQGDTLLHPRRHCALKPEDPSMGASALLAGAFVVRRDVLNAVGGYDPALRVSENQDLGLRLLDHLATGSRRLAVENLDVVVIDILTEAPHSRMARYGTSRAEAARLMLDRYPQRLAASPEDAAALHRIIARTALDQHDARKARRAALSAFRIRPGRWENVKYVLLTFTPGADRLLGMKRSREEREPGAGGFR